MPESAPENTSVAERINERIDTMPAGERAAAQTLIANYPILGLKTVAEFSAQAGVSSPTILRFVNRLGFQNYPEFQAHLQNELAAQLQSPHHRNENPDKAPDTAYPAVEHTQENIRETFRHLGARQLQQAVAALSNAKGNIYLIGGRFTDPIAQYMTAHMTIIRPQVFHLGGQESVWRDRLLDMGKRDVLVVFDIRRYQDSLLGLAEKARARGVEVILVTDQWLSPIARVARHVLAGRTAVPSAWDSSAALFVLAETLIREMTRMLEKDSAARIAELEGLR
ncbi:MurR/RpiR family transcriptional regulator [Ochrobactrum soli]|uniref:MurR/RpiR family transcriptional regulator n=1 Tax=Ochrobactrum teleogrylli TaxID=2479765 RepID=A0ABY2Y9Q5_9HYPH|nr:MULTISPECIES: MurR/RpiR family transcriptional regulator [Brucella]MCI1001221.1 MurR/RpiR family transcriptional regulator [Ochrobactrum sp. C6C9]RRD24540.1 MurR/RpiR family transcriptional regulator [Brucellaceae bacterium VT-16-1752]WHT43237.1 MurR/RpiR family transcriptional regulator [Ochrobactrum sp. SSR]MDX4074286.1 MurR/RpiR family transcriptional regulator [Brucella sp. NBRC 113783]RLL74227.1 MurR/RpiR family transcriptional regulator [[Ochrobactrum] soli]